MQKGGLEERRAYAREYMRRKRAGLPTGIARKSDTEKRIYTCIVESRTKREDAAFDLHRIEQAQQDLTASLMGDPPPGRRELIASIR